MSFDKSAATMPASRKAPGWGSRLRADSWRCTAVGWVEERTRKGLDVQIQLPLELARQGTLSLNGIAPAIVLRALTHAQ